MKLVIICHLNMPTAAADGVLSGYCQFYTVPEPTPPSGLEYVGLIGGSWVFPQWVQIEPVEKRRPST